MEKHGLFTHNTVRVVQLSVSEGSGYTLTTILTTTMSTLEPCGKS